MPKTLFRPSRFVSAAGMSALLLAGQTAPLLGNPTGGAVVAGGATIGAAGPTLTVNQSTQSAIINWQTFSIANGETTKFIVPNSGAATLNRVASGNPSQIYGNLQSNGILYLVNPSGIVVGPNGRIDTASFMASTLDVSNQQFLAGGDLHFAGNSDASIENAGTIHASMGDVYLIANQVNNKGTITAAQGTVGLAAGNDVLFQQAGNQHLFVQSTPSGTKRATGVNNAGTIRAAAAELKAAGGNAYALAINNTGVIAATGYKKVNGQVYLTSDGGSIKNSGKISAKQANGNGGTIALTGTSSTGKASANTVTNSGTLDASATVAGGTGGTISVKNMTGATVHSGAIVAQGGQGGAGGSAEVSGETLGFTGTVDFTAIGGTTGNLLLDPATLNVITGGTGSIISGQNDASTTIDPTAVSSALGSSNVILNANTNITITNGITWTGNTTLSLSTNVSGSTININAPISGVNGRLVINPANSTDVVTPGANGSINVSTFFLQSGDWNQVAATLPGFSANHGFVLNNPSTFLRATGGTGSNSTPYTLTDIYGVQGMGTFLNSASQSFQLANSIDATVTSGWGTFVPIGNTTNQFTKSFNGAGFTINNLFINLPNDTSTVGLFGYTNGGLIEKVGLLNANVTGGLDATGGLIGFANNCTIQDCYVTGAVNASATNGDETGGLVGGMNASVLETSYSGANVTGKDVVGGLIGVINSGSLTDCYATGSVTGNAEVGGLVGSSLGHVNTSYSSGHVTGSTNVGGFMGLTTVGGGASTTGDVWDITTSGQTVGVGANPGTGVTGYTTSNLINSSTYVGAGWNIGNNEATNTWLILNGQTRPMLGMEYSTTISTAHQLQLVGVNGSTDAVNYTVANNIDASGTSNASDIWGTSTTNGGVGFVPIASYTATFNGNLNTINGLYINTPSTSFSVGLFSNVSPTGTVNQTILTNARVIGGTGNTGALVGNNSGLVENSSASGTVITSLNDNGAGGLIGASGGTITDSSSSVAVTGDGNLGGLTGFNSGTISGSYSTGQVTALNNFNGVGGFVGYNSNGTITTSYSTSAVSSVATGTYLAGFVGYNSGQIMNAFATGAVTAGGSGNSSVAGFAGFNSGTIQNTYSAGLVTGNGASDVGGFAGTVGGGAINNSFWATDTSGQAFGLGGSGSATGLTAATTAQLKSQSFILANSPTSPTWDFTNVWTTTGGTTLPQLIGLPAVGSGSSNDSLSGTVYLDSGLTMAGANLTIDLLSGGSIIGSTTTNSSGGFTFSLTSAQLTGGILLTDATDNGNTYYQANTPATTITGIDIWGATLRLMGDTATTTSLATAKGSLTNGVNYTVNGTFLSTTVGVNLNILSNYVLDGVTAANDITVNHALTSNTTDLAVLIAGRNVTINSNITNTGGGDITLVSGNLDNGVGTVAFGNSATISTSGGVAIFYNPSVNPAGSAVNTTSYANPTENFAPNVTGGGPLSTFMLVNTLNDLQNVKNNLTGSYALSQNIDATPTATWNSGAGFVPIGTYDYSDSSDANTFSGVFVGQGHTINGLTINLPTNINGTGLFGDTATAGVIENLNLTNATIAGTTYVGVLAGVNNATVINVTTSGSVTGTNYVGGLAGIIAANITNSSSAGTVTGNSGGQDVGGLVGFVQGGTITVSSSSATVSGPGNNVGGLVGENAGQVTNDSSTAMVTGSASGQNVGGLVGINSGTVSNSSSAATVSAVNNAGVLVGNNRGTIQLSYSTGTGLAQAGFDGFGGLVGYNSTGTIEDSYSTASVTALGSGFYLGGFVGANAATIRDSYAAGPVTGTSGASYLGGFVGTSNGSIHNAYSTGLVTANGATNVGGFGGHMFTAAENSFYDTDSSGQSFAVGDDSTNTTVTAATTAQLTSQAFITANSPIAPTYDFTNVWTTVGGTLTPQLIGLPHTALPTGSGPLDTLSGTAYSDQGATFSAGVLIELISGGSVLGSTTTNGSGDFSFNLSSAALTNGLLLTDATDKGNTFFQEPTGTSVTHINLWGSTVLVLGDSAPTNATLAAAVGTLPMVANGIQYSVAAGALATTVGENIGIFSHYDLEGNITASGTFRVGSSSVLTGSASPTLTGSSFDMEGTFNRTGALTITSTMGEVLIDNAGTSGAPSTLLGLTIHSAQDVEMSEDFLMLGAGGFTAIGTGYVSSVDANGEANGINLFNDSITSAGAISLTGTAGYTSDGNGGLSAGQGVFIGSDGRNPALLSATGTANLTINGTFNQNITSSSLLTGVIIVKDVGNASNIVSVADGRLAINGTVSQGTTTGDSKGVYLDNAPIVQATGAGSVAITGTESAVGAVNRTGIDNQGSTVNVADGALTETGTVTRGTAMSSIGVNLIQGANVSATGTGSVAVTGNTTGSSASFNTGVYLDGSTLASSGAAGLSVTGNAGAVTGATPVTVGVDGISYNPTSAGILLFNGTSLSTTNAGGIHLTGVAGPNNSTAPITAYGADTGVRFEPSGGTPVTVTSVGGGIVITGTSGAGAGTFFNVGVNVATAHIQDTGNGAVTITGFGGAGQADNSGVTIEGATTSIQAGSGNGSSGTLTIIGHGATGVAGSQNDGISIFNTAQLTSGTGGIVITGNTGTPGNGSSGVLISTASLTTPTGALAINSTGGGLSIGATISAATTAYSTPLGTTATLSNINASTTLSGGNFFVTQSGNLVLNTTTVQTLGLDVTGSITQVGRVSAGQLEITNASSVTLTDPTNVINSLGGINSSGGFNFFTDPGLTLTSVVTSGGPITIAETGGPLTLASGAQVIETGTANIILAAGTNLANSNYFINDSTAGANAVQAGSGNFYLFSSDPTYDSLGGITFAPANMVYNAVYPTSASNFTGNGNAAFFYVAGSGQVGPNAPNQGPTVPNTTTGGADGAGSNIVPPVLVTQVSQILPQTQGDPNTGNFLTNGGADQNGNQPPPFSFTGTGVSQLLGQLDGGLANSASNSGQVTSGDIAQLSNGQYNNVANPQAADVLNEALGPIVYANLADALRALGEWSDVPASANDTAANDGETILTGGDVAEMTGTSAKKIPLSQAPEQLQNALKDDSLKDAGH